MGRYYSGDIEGKFWFAVQNSSDAIHFGGTHDYIDGEGEVLDEDDQDEAVEMYFHFDQSHMENIRKGITLCLEQLGEYREELDNFFERQESYNNQSLAKELEISEAKVDKLLPPYARLILGLKIENYVGENGECNFEAEL
jgi:hypothetical protein